MSSSSSLSRGAPSCPTGSAPDTKPLFLKQTTPFSSPMTKSKDSIDLIEISSSNSDADYQDSVGEESDHERDGEEAGTNRRGNEEGKKGASAVVSPSSVEVKTAEDKKVEDDECYILDFDPFESAVTDLANKLSLGNGDVDDREEDDLSVLAEKGEVSSFGDPERECSINRLLVEIFLTRGICVLNFFLTTHHMKVTAVSAIVMFVIFRLLARNGRALFIHIAMQLTNCLCGRI